jgi:hypothetical protein
VTDRPYCPSNGSEGEGFEERFCNRCEREAEYRSTGDGRTGCTILTAAYMFDMKEAEYPSEWITNEKGDSRCTAFEDESKVTDGLREYRKAVALGQKDLFDG